MREDVGARGCDEGQVPGAIDAAGGFSFLLAGLKALLERGVDLNLIADHARADLVAPFTP